MFLAIVRIDDLQVYPSQSYEANYPTNIEITNYGSTLYEPGQFETFTAHDIEQRVLGSKIEFASEHVSCPLEAAKDPFLTHFL